MSDLRYCACGCGQSITSVRWKNARWVRGHSSRRSEHRALAAQIGREHGSRERASTQKAIVSPTACDLGWAAGFIEGEGYLRKQRRGTATVLVPQVNREPVERLLRLFGGSLRLRTDRRGNANDIWIWAVYGARARGVMMTLYSFLTEKRKGQIRESLGVT